MEMLAFENLVSKEGLETWTSMQGKRGLWIGINILNMKF